MTVSFRNGTARSAAVARVRGDGPSALSDPVVAAKPFTLLGAAAGLRSATALLDAVDSLDRGGLDRLTVALRGMFAPS